MERSTRVFGVPKLPIAFARGLRFRLTLSYVLFFTVLLIGIGLFFRQTLQIETEGDVRSALDDEWTTAKGYLRIENQQPLWVADVSYPDEAFVVSRLRHVYLIADANGLALQYDETYASIGLDSPAEVKAILKGDPVVRLRKDKDGTPYLIKAGRIQDSDGRPYFFAIGRSLADSRKTVARFTGNYFLMLPALIALTGLLGWALAGRAIRPVNLVAHAAQNITGSNLSLQISPRGAGDELDHLIDSFNRMTARLKQSFEQSRRFSTDVSHELRTPLTAIRGQLEVALFTAETSEQYRDAMVNALEDVEKLSNIVRALLLLSQAESGHVVLQRTPIDLQAAVADVVDQFQIPAEEKGVTLSANLSDGVSIMADRTQVERLISNLLSNALKYTPAGGQVRVTTGRTGPDGANHAWAQIAVEDSGCGIPAENLPYIFDRFYRVRNGQTNLIEGLGLGLSFVSWIVDAHGGKIEVASTEGQGSRFTVLLPAERAADTKPDAVEAIG